MSDIFALDLGTTKFCLAAYQGGRKLDLCILPAGGVHRGMLSDLSAAKWVLLELIDAAEKKFNTRIRSIAVGVTGQSPALLPCLCSDEDHCGRASPRQR